MKKILWISRHEMTPQQEQDLSRIVNDEFEFIILNKTIKIIDEIAPYIEKVNLITAVLPTLLLSELVKLAKDIPVLQSVSERVESIDETTNTKKFTFVHSHWQQIVKMDIEYKNL